jgi:multicomponent Na+:H+ antiporter subunit C
MEFLTFAIERYNYWIFIILMMTGLYTVIARGNLVKKLIGLNIFQTSVFIYYISIGKIFGGTAPIYLYEDMKARTKHDGGHGEEHGAGYGEKADGSHGSADTVHASGDANDISTAVADPGHGAAAEAQPIHGAETANHINDVSTGAHDAAAAAADTVISSHDVVGAAARGAMHAASEVIYSNPLPHVLILTAIVVGVATTAVGLGLAVRIREAYGTIEEDELETADNIAEFGVADPRTTAEKKAGAGA